MQKLFSLLQNNTLLVTLSQSGETADTVEALKAAKKINSSVRSLCISNTADSSLTRLSDLNFLTHAGPEIGVASTKAFTTQLVSLALLLCSIGKLQNKINTKQEKEIVIGLKKLPGLISEALLQESQIKKLANQFSDKNSALFLGRGTMHAIALEGALKLKEISYIHAEAYPAGELKHGPIALIEEGTPVIAIAPEDSHMPKMEANIRECASRGANVILISDRESSVEDFCTHVIRTPHVGPFLSPFMSIVPLHLLSYHVAIRMGRNVDRPRNLAKSVTVI